MIQILQGTISYPEVKWGKAEDRLKNTPLVKILDEIKGIGADGIELWGRHLDNLSEADIKALAKAIKASGQKVVVFGAYTDFASSDESVKAAMEEGRRYLKLMNVFGAKKMRIFAGGGASAEAKPEHWSRAIAGMKELAKMYAGTGMMFVIETHDSQLADTPETAVRLVKEVNDPSIRLNYQYMRGDIKKELDTVWPYVEHVHMSFAARYNSRDDEVMKELVKRGYDKTITLEFCTDSLPKEGETFSRAKAIAGMKKDIALLRSLMKK